MARLPRWRAVAACVLLVAGCKQGRVPPAPVHADAGEDPALPGRGAGTPALTARLRAALAAKGAGYRPRTHHLNADGSPKYTNRLILEASPYLLQHAHNPVDWYAVGRRGVRAREARGQADLPLDRLLDLPLVPRHGGRIVRGRGDRAHPQRALRRDQGRSRGAARRRRRLHERGPVAHRVGRLADERVADARRARRSSAERISRRATASAARGAVSSRCSRSWPLRSAPIRPASRREASEARGGGSRGARRARAAPRRRPAGRRLPDAAVIAPRRRT